MWTAVFTFFDFTIFYAFKLNLYIFGLLKCLMISWSIKNIDTINTLFLWVPLLIKTWFKTEMCPSCLRFSFFICPLMIIWFAITSSYAIFYNFLVSNTCNELHKTCSLSQVSIFTISKLKAINNNKSFYRLVLMPSVDRSSNPGPIYNHNLPNWEECDIFIKGLRFLHYKGQ